MLKAFVYELFRPIIEDEFLRYVSGFFIIIGSAIFGLWLFVMHPAIFRILLILFWTILMWFTLVPHIIRSWKSAKLRATEERRKTMIYGIWLNWPGMWITDSVGNPRAWDTEAAARAWAEAAGINPDAIEIREL